MQGIRIRIDGIVQYISWDNILRAVYIPAETRRRDEWFDDGLDQAYQGHPDDMMQRDPELIIILRELKSELDDDANAHVHQSVVMLKNASITVYGAAADELYLFLASQPGQLFDAGGNCRGMKVVKEGVEARAEPEPPF